MIKEKKKMNWNMFRFMDSFTKKLKGEQEQAIKKKQIEIIEEIEDIKTNKKMPRRKKVLEMNVLKGGCCGLSKHELKKKSRKRKQKRLKGYHKIMKGLKTK